MQKIANVGLIGCGHIAETYFRAHKYFCLLYTSDAADDP